ncbi:MAG: protein kinase [Lachnospiraceae bacterium]|nr:protein kinase [Lachnospiraceae bacterium]
MLSMEDRYKLSCYPEVTEIDRRKGITIVKNVDTDQLFIKKIRPKTMLPVYKRLRELSLSMCPLIEEILVDDRHIVVIEEYIGGRSLDKYIGDNGLEKLDLNVVVTGIINNLRIMHEMNPPIIHRDLKPSNIMVTSDKRIMFTDLDTFREYDGDKEQDTYYMGTQGFAAPEQYGFRESDGRADIYSFGVVLNILLTGGFPDKKKPANGFREVVEKCIELKPEDRYRDIYELSEDLYILKLLDDYDGKKKSNIKSVLFGYSKKREKYPVGYRKGKLLNMIIATVVYLAVIVMDIMIVVSHVQSERKEPGTIEYWFNMNVIFFGTIIWCWDYLGIRSKIVQFKGKNKDNKALKFIASAIILIGYWSFIGLFLLFFGEM